MSSTPINLTFGQIVKERRMALGLTQAELARRVGCATVTVRKIEYDTLQPSVQIAERLAFSLNIPEAEQLGFVQLARATHTPSPIPTPSPLPGEIGMEDLSGRAIKGFELAERIGTGGFGIVYRATQTGVDRDVAVKIILPQYVNNPGFIRRFEAEAQTVAHLEHPYIVPLYDYWREPNVACLIMRYLRGGNLATELQKGPMDLAAVNNAFQQFGQGLHAAHCANIIHRDIKPANILLDEDRNAYLADFGIAKSFSNGGQTEHGAFLGSPAYISPEQIKQEPIKPQADIYSVGVMLYELLTNRKPFPGPTPILYIQQHLNEALPSILNERSDLPPRLDEIIACATAKDPVNRYPDMQALLTELQAVANNGTAVSIQIPQLTPQQLAGLENPFKGLRPFIEADAHQFYGRTHLIHELLSRLDDEDISDGLTRFLAVVGPSGSGKSSVVRAGLIPALRRGGIDGSQEWFITDMTPGTDPYTELETALLRVAVSAPANLSALLHEDANGLLQASRYIMPSSQNSELLLLIDQFEELFTLVTDAAIREQFLDMLVTTIVDPTSRVRIVITLRADFMDEPLRTVDFGELLRQRTTFVLPLSPEELEQAIVLPVQKLGLEVEPGLLASLLHDVGDEPGALPLLQYTLTELFEHRNGRFLTLTTYQQMGGVSGALARRADDIYDGLDEDGRRATEQLFLRLITLGEGNEDTRRRVRISELNTLQLSAHILHSLDEYGRYRILTFDHDPTTRQPTVEVAHEALLSQWGLLRRWIKNNREDIQRERQLADATIQWQSAKQDASYLLQGSRLSDVANWAETTSLALTVDEQTFLEASLEARAEQEESERERQQRELATAQQLANSERERADAQTAFVQKLRRRAVYLVILLLLVLGAALAAAYFAQSNAVLADENLAKADALATQESIALNNLAQSEQLRLAAEANNVLAKGDMGDLAALLALRSLQSGYTAEADEALMQALNRGFALETLHSRAQVRDLDFSPDGRYLASADTWDNAVRIWDSQTGEVIRFRIPQVAQSVAFTPDGNHLLIGASSDVMVMLNSKTGEIENQFDSPGFVSDITMSPDGKTVFISGFGGMLRDLENNRQIQSFNITDSQPKNIFLDADFSPNGQHIATAGYDHLVRLWDVATGEEIAQFPGHSAQVVSIAFAPDGKHILSASADGSALLWEIATGDTVYELDLGAPIQFAYPQGWSAVSRIDQMFDGVGDVIFAPDGKTIISSSMTNRHVQMWDAASGQLLRTWENVGGDAGALSPDGRLVAASNKQALHIWQLHHEPVPTVLYGHDGGIIDVAYAPDGQTIASASWDNFARVWDADSGQMLGALPPVGPAPPMYAIAYTDEPDTIWVNLGMTIWRWPYHEARASQFAQGDYWQGGYGFSPDGRYALYPPTSNHWAVLHDGATGEYVQQFAWDKAHNDFDNRWTNAISPDNRYVLSKRVNDNNLHLWDVETGEIVRVFTGHTGAISYLTFSPDSQMILSSSADGTARLWDVEGGTEIRQFVMPTGWPYNVAFAPDGRSVLTGGTDGKARLWDVQTGEQLRVFAGHEDRVTAVDFAPDGRTILTGSDDHTLRLWPTDLAETIELACAQLSRDFTPSERNQYGIPDDRPTCANMAN